MRIVSRVLLAVLGMGLICGAIHAFPGSSAAFLERGTTFHKPHYPSLAIETAPVSATTSSPCALIAAPGTGCVLRDTFGTPVATRRRIRAIAPSPETALDQRPPPHSLLA